MNPAAMFPMGMMKGPNGQMMQPPSSHPAFGQMNQQQQMEMFRQAQARNGQAQMANGFMPQQQGAPNMMGQPPPQPPNMTPHQRHAAMPPPPAPGNDGPRIGTGPSSPSHNQAPPTPSQGNKANNKSKKETKAAAAKVNTPKHGCATFAMLTIFYREVKRVPPVRLLKRRPSSPLHRLQRHPSRLSLLRHSLQKANNLNSNSNHHSLACLRTKAATCPMSLHSAAWRMM
jgi:hypothetical protein